MRCDKDRHLWNTWIFESVPQQLISYGAGHAPEIQLVATPYVSECRVCVWRPLPHQNDSLQRVFPLRQHTRTERQYGQIRLHHFGLSVDGGLWGQTAQVLIDDEAVRIEPAERLLVSYPRVYDTVRRRIAPIGGQGRQQERQCQVLPLALVSVELMRSVWRMPPDQRGRGPRGRRHTLQASLFEPFAGGLHMAHQLRQLPHGEGRPLPPEPQGLPLLKATHGQPRATLAMLQVAAQSDDFSLEVDWGT
jgi:hypothetical protein